MTKDRLKEEIGLYKLLMTITSAISCSIVGWLSNNIEEILSITGTIVSSGMIIFLTITAFFLVRINTKIKELDYE